MTTLRGLEKLNEIRDGALANREFRMSPHTAGLDNTLIDGTSPDTDGIGHVARRERLGGLLNFYYREAA